MIVADSKCVMSLFLGVLTLLVGIPLKANRVDIRPKDGGMLVLEATVDNGSYGFLQKSEDLIHWDWVPGILLLGDGGVVKCTLSSPDMGKAAFYRLIITNDFDAVPMQFDWVGDGIPLGWKLRYGFNFMEPLDPHGDDDGDGYSLMDEYLAGRHPLRRDHPDVALVVMRGIF